MGDAGARTREKHTRNPKEQYKQKSHADGEQSQCRRCVGSKQALSAPWRQVWDVFLKPHLLSPIYGALPSGTPWSPFCFPSLFLDFFLAKSEHHFWTFLNLLPLFHLENPWPLLPLLEWWNVSIYQVLWHYFRLQSYSIHLVQQSFRSLWQCWGLEVEDAAMRYASQNNIHV